MSEFKDDLSQPNMMKCTPSFSSNCSRPLIEQTDEERMRAEFEKWANENQIRTDRHPDNGYIWFSAQDSWEAWQACWKLCGGVK